MAVIKQNKLGEYLLGRVEVRVKRDDVADYIKMRLSSDPHRPMPKELDELLYEYRKDVIYHGKKYIQRYRSIDKKVDGDIKLKSYKLADRYFKNAKKGGN